MKKLIFRLFICFTMLSVTIATAYAIEFMAEKVNFKIKVNCEEKEIDQDIVAISDHTYVPLRILGNLLGYGVQWDETTKTVSMELPTYEYPNYTTFKEGEKYGYKDEKGNVIIKPQFKHAEDFVEGIGRVRLENNDFACINLNGSVVIQGINVYTDFKDGIAIAIKADDELRPDNVIVTDNNFEMYYIDKSGNMLFNRCFPQVKQFNEGLACVQLEGSPMETTMMKYSYIDKSGIQVTEEKYEMAGSFKDGYAKVKKDGIWGKIDHEFNFTPDTIQPSLPLR